MKETQTASTGHRGALAPAQAARYREAGFGVTEGIVREGEAGVHRVMPGFQRRHCLSCRLGA